MELESSLINYVSYIREFLEILILEVIRCINGETRG